MANRYWVGGSGTWDSSSTTNWSATSGGAGGASVPTSADSVIFNSASGSSGYVVTVSGSVSCLSIQTITTSMTIAGSGNITCNGPPSIASITTWSNTGTLTITGNASITIVPTISNLTIAIAGSVGTLSANLTCTGVLTLTSGPFNANGYNVTVNTFNSNNSNTRTLTMGSGTWTLTNTAAATIWDLTTTTNLTYTANTAPIVVSGASGTNAITFAGGGQTYGNLSFTNTAASGTITFTGANTFGTLSSSRTGNPYTIVFPNATTTVSGWSINGSASNLVTLSRTGGSGTWTIAKSGGGTVTTNFVNISNSTATPSSTWYAGPVVIDNGGNTGWNFISGNSFLMFCS